MRLAVGGESRSQKRGGAPSCDTLKFQFGACGRAAGALACAGGRERGGWWRASPARTRYGFLPFVCASCTSAKATPIARSHAARCSSWLRAAVSAGTPDAATLRAPAPAQRAFLVFQAHKLAHLGRSLLCAFAASHLRQRARVRRGRTTGSRPVKKRHSSPSAPPLGCHAATFTAQRSRARVAPGCSARICRAGRVEGHSASQQPSSLLARLPPLHVTTDATWTGRR
jgi:hypothetical protein